jgi:hypothetical protein
VVGNREGKKEMVSHADVLGYFKTRIALRASLSDETLEYYKLTATPTTRLIDDTGRVEHEMKKDCRLGALK